MELYKQKLKFVWGGVILGSFFVFGFFYENVSSTTLSVVVTELAPYEQTGYEWIEIQNVSAVDVDITDWKFWEDGVNHKITGADYLLRAGEIAIIAMNDVLFREAHPAVMVKVFDSSWGSLKETGEVVGMRNKAGELVEEFSYPPAKNFSLERVDSQKVDYTENNWREHPSSNSAGVINHWSGVNGGVAVQKESFNNSSLPVIEGEVYVQGIKISSLLPNPIGSDTLSEYIELTNSTDGSVSLYKWTLSDNSKKVYIIDEIIIQPKEKKRFFRSATGIALNNSGGDTVTLLSPVGDVMDSVSYTKSAKEGEVINFDGVSSVDALHNNVGDIILTASVPVNVSLGEMGTFDASDSVAGTPLKVRWVIDGYEFLESHVVFQFLRTGSVLAELFLVSDVTSTSQKYVISVLIDMESLKKDIIISELLPNPYGPDNEEFIELYNGGSNIIDLSGYKLDDIDGGSKPYTLPIGTSIRSGEYVVFMKKDTKITLNNTDDSARLLTPDSRVVTELAYQDAEEGQSFGVVDGVGEVWMMTPTPGSINRLTYGVYVEGETYIAEDESNSIEMSPADIAEHLIGAEVSVRGVVSVEPGVLGSQYFYIVDDMGGVQVYMNKKDFPKLFVGDRVVVTGEVSSSYGEMRVKLSKKESIKKIDHPGAPTPIIINIEQVGEEYEGALVQVRGDVTEVKGSSYFYIDDNTEEVRVYLKKGVNVKKSIKVNDTLVVVGVVSERRGVYQILPRSDDDIEGVGRANMVLTPTDTKDKIDDHDLRLYIGGTIVFCLLFLLFRKKNRSS